MSNRKVLKILTALMLCSALAFSGSAQQVISEAGKLDASASEELQAFKRKIQAANPGMDVVSVEADLVKRAVLAPRAAPPANPKVAIFVKNQTRVPGMDDEVDGVRDRIGAELAGAGMIIMEQSEIAGGFNRFKVTTAEERAGLVDGVFTGGSTVRVAQMLGCDYLMLVNIIRASSARRNVGGRSVTIYTLNMSTKVNEAVQGSSVYGSNWSRKVPVPGEAAAADDPINYYNDLIDQWSTQTGEEIAAKAPTWRRADAAQVNMVSFSVSTTIDELIQGLEGGVRAPNELLDEMRHAIGGVTVELDGAALGSSPGTFQATPGLHQLRITRQWMTPWQKSVNIQEGAAFSVGLELSDAGINRYQSMEGFRSLVAFAYAEAVMRKGVKVNFDTAAWRNVSVGDKRGDDVNVGVGTTVVK
ncbi:MAG: PEGA domain-containing protein [Kiritimatiellia bacterium]